jgi:multidrug transporter EmrE-like cation transporter
LPSFKKGGADETRSAIYPTLVIIGSAVMIFIIPAYMMYNSSFFGLSNDMLPLTATLSVVVWLGFLRKEVKSIPSKIFYAILTGVTTYVFLYHIAGILWYWHFFGR